MKKILILLALVASGCATYPVDQEACKNCCTLAGYDFEDVHKYGCECKPLKKPEIFTIKE